MATMRQTVTRFRRGPYNPHDAFYRTKTPLWHIAAADYRKGRYYREYVALCGYTADGLLGGVTLSIAKVVKGPECKVCIRKAAAL